MKRKIHPITEYQGISADVWAVFKKYFPAGADLSSFTDDVHTLDKKYEKDVRQYCFMQKLLKVYFDELNELKGLRDADGQS
jgi:hypothetical protein